ncbi:L,D-transpeptidase [Acerihabitans sp. TG2]|uniref:L,D-transpeptidase n=1 Tax=Acerihabitans sp. TG2 TaxID=3096008 RepID=UPI002B22BDFD|nr:L,D-transpeptidase [Acerihabitans sp. TG2]MEA9390661.1 L,D-transpeptidase [Acerihabitans sp. TG2]
MLRTNTVLWRRTVTSCLLALTLIPLIGAQAQVTTAPILPNTQSLGHSRAALSTVLPAGIKPYYAGQLAAIYAARHNQPLWRDRTAVQQFQQQLAELALSGVQPQFITWTQWLTNPNISPIGRDIILSDAMLGYLQYVSGVEKNGETWLYGNSAYRLAPPPAPAVEHWLHAVDDGGILQFIASLAPQHPQYLKMHQALKTMLTQTRPWPQLTGKDSLRPGQLSDDIPALRDILRRSGMLSAEPSSPLPTADSVPADVRTSPPLSAAQQSVVVSPAADSLNPSPSTSDPAVVATVDPQDKVFSPDLVEAVKRFQSWQGLTADGIIGRQTRDWLNVSPQTRVTLLALNIQRLRLLNNRILTGIQVNIPNYSLVYYQQGNKVLSSRVIVGRPSRKTPLMRSALSSVVLNPPWNVPESLVRQDIIPKAMHDAGYLQRNGFVVLSGWSGDVEAIDPDTLNWGIISPAHFPFRLRQSPGANNALGRYKFNMPSSDAIYLHDTPNHNLFSNDMRALSSGCVRVNKASDLANMLLQDAGWGNTRVSETLEQGNTTYVSIRHRIPVNLFYLTAWVADDGKPQFRTDIYNYDTSIKLGAKSLPTAERLLQ